MSNADRREFLKRTGQGAAAATMLAWRRRASRATPTSRWSWA